MNRLMSAFALLFAFHCLASEQTALSPNTISLPDGPGSVTGLGDSFSPSLNSGTSHYSIPLQLPPGRAGLAFRLSLEYNSGYGNGVAGQGFSLPFPMIQRQADKGLPLYTDWPEKDQIDNDRDGSIDEPDEYDNFVFNSSEELIAINPEDKTYRLKVEGRFLRFKRLDTGWEVSHPDGKKWYFGEVDNAIVSDGNTRDFAWYLTSQTDTNGNQIHYHYARFDASRQVYLTSVTYNYTEASKQSVEVKLNYESRPDIISSYRAGFEILTTRRLSHIDVTAAGHPVRSFQLEYEEITGLLTTSVLKELKQLDAQGHLARPPLKTKFTLFEPSSLVEKVATKMPKVDPGIENRGFADLNSDGLPDLIYTNDGEHDYWLNKGENVIGTSQWSARQSMTDDYQFDIGEPGINWVDISGDGMTDILDTRRDTRSYLYQLDDTHNWKLSSEFDSIPMSLDDGETQFIDINNDRKIDVLRFAYNGDEVYAHQVSLNRGEQWSERIALPIPDAMRRVHFGDEGVQLADMNGDRMLDVVQISEDTLRYFPSKGIHGFGEPVTYHDIETKKSDLSRLEIADINHDGLGDLVWLKDEKAKVWINAGLDPENTAEGRFLSPFRIESETSYGDYSTLLDLNGNGSTDLVWYDKDIGYSYVDFAPSEQPFQLKEIDNGIGLLTTITYTTVASEMARDEFDGNAWEHRIPIGMQVVKSISKKDLLSGVEQLTSIDYHNGYYDRKEHEFRGFAATEKTLVGSEKSNAGAPSLVTEYKFDTGINAEAMKGKILEIDIRTGDGNAFNKTKFDWQITQLDEGVSLAQTQRKTLSYIEQGRGQPIHLMWEYQYDAYGNPTKKVEYGRLDSGWQDERQTITRYSADFPDARRNWLLTYPIEEKVLNAAGKVVSKRQFFYDDETFSGDNPGAVGKGNLTMLQDWILPDVSNATVTTLRNRYDEYGNVTFSFDPLWGKQAGHFSETIYDSSFYTFPIAEIQHLENTSLTTKAVYDPGLGVPISITDYNGEVTRMSYDSLARITQIIHPGDSSDAPTVQYSYETGYQLDDGRVVNWIEENHRETVNGGTLDSRKFFDGHGRHVMTRMESEIENKFVVKNHSVFGPRGESVATYLPYFADGFAYQDAPENASKQEREFDALLRSLKTLHPLVEGETYQKFRKTEYLPLVIQEWDEAQSDPNSIYYGRYKTKVFDGLLDGNGVGRLRELHENVSMTDIGENGGATAWVTRYEYDALDNLTRLIDSQNNKTDLLWDGLGRNYFTNDVNKGHSWQVFDEGGNVVRQRNAKGETIAFDFDGQNRFKQFFTGILDTELLELGGTVPEPYQLWTEFGALPTRPATGEYRYDKAVVSGQGNHLKGRLASIKHDAGSKYLGYDKRGNINYFIQFLFKQGTIGDELSIFTTRKRYDSSNRVQSYTYPDGSTINYNFNARGLISGIPNVIDNITYDASGRMTHIDFGNGVNRSMAYDVRGRIKDTTTIRKSDNLELQNLSFRFDAVSNLTQVLDKQSQQDADTVFSELGMHSLPNKGKFNLGGVYEYDDVYRLTSAKNTASWGKREYRYDRIGNMLKYLTQNGPDDVQSEYFRYGGSDSSVNLAAWNQTGRSDSDLAGPHALTEVMDEHGKRLESWVYDEVGNVTQQGDTKYQWDSRNRLIQTTNTSGTTHYLYDNDNLLKRKLFRDKFGTGTQTLYIDSHSEWKDGEGLLKYAFLGGQRVALSTLTSATFTPEQFFLSNHQGSTEMLLDNKANITQLIAYEPFGAIRGKSGEKIGSSYLFLGKEHDVNTGLDYLEQRHHQARRARMISPDPVFILKERFVDPQHWASYAYGRNNPLRYADLTGESAGPPDEYDDVPDDIKQYIFCCDEQQKQEINLQYNWNKDNNFSEFTKSRYAAAEELATQNRNIYDSYRSYTKSAAEANKIFRNTVMGMGPIPKSQQASIGPQGPKISDHERFISERVQPEVFKTLNPHLKNYVSFYSNYYWGPLSLQPYAIREAARANFSAGKLVQLLGSGVAFTRSGANVINPASWHSFKPSRNHSTYNNPGFRNTLNTP